MTNGETPIVGKRKNVQRQSRIRLLGGNRCSRLDYLAIDGRGDHRDDLAANLALNVRQLETHSQGTVLVSNLISPDPPQKGHSSPGGAAGRTSAKLPERREVSEMPTVPDQFSFSAAGAGGRASGGAPKI